MAQPLGRLVRVDARQVWQHEAQHFTPWLRDNVDRLNEELGIEIEIDAIEVGVGDFTADLRGTDATSGRPVVIENQLGPTDHLTSVSCSRTAPDWTPRSLSGSRRSSARSIAKRSTG